MLQPPAIRVLTGLVAAVLSFSPAAALEYDFEWANPKPQGNGLAALAFEDALTGYAVGNKGANLRTTDGGQSWILQTRYPDFQQHLRDVIVLGPGELLAAGPGLFRSTDSGATWSPVPDVFVGVRHLMAIPDPGPVISAVGGLGEVLRSTDGGATWAFRTSPGIRVLVDQFWLDANTGYVVGENVARRTTDGGLTWQTLAGVTEQSVSYTDVFFTDPLNGWILEHFTTHRTTDGGASWFERHGPIGQSPIYQEEALVLDAAHRFVITNLEGADIWETTTDGTTWTLRYRRSNTRGYTDIERLADGTLVVTSTDGDLLRSTDAGQTWNNFVTSPGEGERTTIQTLRFLPGGRGFAGGMDGVWLESTDGGGTWDFGSGPPGIDTPRAIEFRNELLGLVAGYGPLGQTKVARTTDGGATWVLHSVSATYTGYVQQIAFPTDQIAYAVTHGGSGINYVYRSTDGGQTWALRNQGIPTSIRLECIFFVDVNTGFVGGGEFSSDAALWKTTDGGADWTSVPEAGILQAAVQDMYWSDATTGLVVGYRGVSRTTNGGQSWNPILHEQLLDLDFRDSLHGYACSYFDPWIWVTINGGQTWENVNTPWEGNPYDIAATADGFVISGGGSVILRASEAGTAGLAEGGAGSAPLARRHAVRVWPNPSRGPEHEALTFGIESPVAGPVELRVYDVAGRLLETMTRRVERGTAAIAWRSAARSGGWQVVGGTYFVKARFGTGEEARGRFVVVPEP